MSGRLIFLAVMAFGAGFGLSLSIFYGLRFLVVSVQHGGVW